MIYLVRSGALEGYERLVTELGGNPYLLLKWVGLSACQLQSADTYLAYEKVAELLEITAVMCECPLFGLQLSTYQNNLTLGDIGLISTQQATVGEAIAHTIKHIRLHANGVNIYLDNVDNKVTISLTFSFNSPKGVNQLSQLSIGLLANTVGFLMGTDKTNITSHLSDPIDKNYAVPRWFRATNFGSTFNGIQFASFWLNKRTNSDKNSITAYLDKQLMKLTAGYPNDLSHQVSHAIQRLLASGECSLMRVAQSLNLHPRVLQSRLKHHDLKYKDILADIRKELVLQALMNTQVNITELAFKLGYADVAVLSRNFRCWFGCSISQYRQNITQN
ncbi:MAG: AraC family transcriptional regulator ligand-binding domain-containing protein [Moritella sp.]|uniref:AraC family transcriptional regulator n=1 Tax=Moritella sp. TaxID=78556 RepID=UPI0025E43C2D|nr:AraC family transcriptional regulator [Moritella sp.]NQZ93257.1 AraC family transcriptional regulator ligand-binding domain-containing protein [Moritella sp.]